MTSNYIYWNVDPEIINVFGISIRYYGLLFVTGLILCVYVLRWIFRRENIPQELLEKLTIYGTIGIVAGARLGHCLFYEPSYYFAHPLEMILPIQSLPGGGYKFSGYQGLASHGGGLGLIIALIIYSYKAKQPLLRTIDLIAIASPLEGFFIRMGNMMNSEILGIPTTKPWAFVFARIDNIPRHPSQLYEAICYMLIFVIMIMLYKYLRKRPQNGFFFGLSLTMIFVARFLIEFLKENQVDFEQDMPIDMGQILSIPYIVIGIGFIIYGLMKARKLLKSDIQ